MNERLISENFVANNVDDVARCIPKKQCHEHDDGEDGVTHLSANDGYGEKLIICIPDNMHPENWPEDWPKFDKRHLWIYNFEDGMTAKLGWFTDWEVQQMAEKWPRNIYFIQE